MSRPRLPDLRAGRWRLPRGVVMVRAEVVVAAATAPLQPDEAVAVGEALVAVRPQLRRVLCCPRIAGLPQR